MKYDDWYNSAKFRKLRLLNNISTEIQQKVFHLYEILKLLADSNPEIIGLDNFDIICRQLKIVGLEARNLVDDLNKLDRKLTPKTFEDEKS